MALTLGLLHRQCVLTVPRAFVLEDPASGARITAAQHHRLMGYEEVETTAAMTSTCSAWRAACCCTAHSCRSMRQPTRMAWITAGPG
ncbi:hypothetical protein HaLaN_21686, partial [Haematococcus lacustris]